MIELFGMASPNVQKIILMLEELELPYVMRRIDVVAGAQFSPEFVELNPNSKVPVIIDPEGPDAKRHVLFESGAILIYLAEKTGRFMPEDRRSRLDVMQWLMVQLTSLGPMTGQFVHFRRYAPSDNDYALSRYRTQMLRVWDVIDARLAKSTWLGGDEYSIADIATYPWIANRDFLEISPASYPNIERWSERIAVRPAAKRLDARIAELLTLDVATMHSATPVQLDRYFGRGSCARTS